MTVLLFLAYLGAGLAVTAATYRINPEAINDVDKDPSLTLLLCVFWPAVVVFAVAWPILKAAHRLVTPRYHQDEADGIHDYAGTDTCQTHQSQDCPRLSNTYPHTHHETPRET